MDAANRCKKNASLFMKMCVARQNGRAAAATESEIAKFRPPSDNKRLYNDLTRKNRCPNLFYREFKREEIIHRQIEM